MALGVKTIETRSWATSYRGDTAIHAGKSLDPVDGEMGLRRLCAERAFFEALEPHFRVVHKRIDGMGWIDTIDIEEFPRGAIVTVVNLAGCWPMIYGEDSGRKGYGYQTWAYPGGPMRFVLPSADECAFGLWLTGRRAWVTTDNRPLDEPLPYRGGQGLRTLPSEITDQIRALLHVGNSPGAGIPMRT